MLILETVLDTAKTNSIGAFILMAISNIFLVIDGLIYGSIGIIYEMFTFVAGSRVLDSDIVAGLAERIYMVFGIIALFLVAYALLTAIIDPDKSSKGDTSVNKIIPNIAMAIILTAIVPTIFEYAYKVQKAVLCENVIPKLIIGRDTGVNSDNAGREMAVVLFQSFFFPNDKYLAKIQGTYNLDSVTSKEQYSELLKKVETKSNDKFWPWEEEETISLFDAYQAVKNGDGYQRAFGPFVDPKSIEEGKVTYLFLFSTLAGGYTIYVLLNFCFDVAKRAAKLVYFQLIAPIPIMSMILPGQKKIFQNWTKKTISCYAELFTRIVILSLGFFVFAKIPDLLFGIINNATNGSGCLENPGFMLRFLGTATIIIGLLMFMKEAPNLTSNLLGLDSKGLNLGIGNKLGEMAFIGKAAKDGFQRTQGALTGALGAGLQSRIIGGGEKGAFGRAFKLGAAEGFKGKGNQFNKQRDYYTQRRFNDSKAKASWLPFGGKRVYEMQDGHYVRDENGNLVYTTQRGSKRGVQDVLSDSSKISISDAAKAAKEQVLSEKTDAVAQIDSSFKEEMKKLGDRLISAQEELAKAQKEYDEEKEKFIADARYNDIWQKFAASKHIDPNSLSKDVLSYKSSDEFKNFAAAAFEESGSTTISDLKSAKDFLNKIEQENATKKLDLENQRLNDLNAVNEKYQQLLDKMEPVALHQSGADFKKKADELSDISEILKNLQEKTGETKISKSPTPPPVEPSSSGKK